MSPRLLVPLLVFSLSLALYLRTLAPGLTFEDSGELIAAAATAGVAHPPGYPLYCLLGKGFTLLPFGSGPEPLARRVNLMSAFFGAASAAMAALILLEIGASAGPALAGGLLAALARDVWSQAVVAEVYTLHNFLVLSTVLAVLRFIREGRLRSLRFGAAFAGLALTNHYPMALLAFPTLFLAALPRLRERARGRPREGLLLGLALAAPLALYAWIPLRAAQGAPFLWGRPDTLETFGHHVLRRSYGEMEFGRSVTGAERARHVGAIASNGSAQWLPAAFLLALPGLLAARGRRPAGERPLLREGPPILLHLGLLLTLPFPLLLGFGWNPETRFLMRVYYLTAWQAAAILMGLGLEALRRVLLTRFPPGRSGGRPRAADLAVLSLGLALAAGTARHHFRENDHSGDRLALTFARDLLRPMDAGSVLLHARSDFQIFPLVYLKVVAREFPEASVADPFGHLFHTLRGRDLWGGPVVDPDEADRRARAAAGEAPIYTLAEEAWVQGSGAPAGLAVREDGNDTGFDVAREFAGPLGIAPENARFMERQALALYHRALAAALDRAGNRPAALRALRRAADFSREDHAGLVELARWAYRRDLEEEGQALLEAALTVYPRCREAVLHRIERLIRGGRFEEARFFLERRAPWYEDGLATLYKSWGTARRNQGDFVGAEEKYRKALESQPRDLETRVWLGGALFYLDRLDEAEEELRRVLEAAPNAAVAHENLGMIYARREEFARAAEHLREACRLAPDNAQAKKTLEQVLGRLRARPAPP